MSNEKNAENNSSAENSNSDENSDKQKPLPFHNPLNPDDHRVITQEDLENEEKYKEALSERD